MAAEMPSAEARDSSGSFFGALPDKMRRDAKGAEALLPRMNAGAPTEKAKTPAGGQRYELQDPDPHRKASQPHPARAKVNCDVIYPSAIIIANLEQLPPSTEWMTSMTQDGVTGKTQVSGSAYSLNTTAICLATVAGYTDGYGLRQFNTFISFMSGNTTIAGVNVGEQKFHAALPEAVAIIFFLVGTFLGHWILVGNYRHSHRIVLLTSAAFMAAFVILNLRVAFIAEFGIALLSASMGIMNPAVARIGAESVNLTFVTGALNKLGSHLALAARGTTPTDAQGSRDTHLRRAGLEGSLWLAFCGGAVFAGLVTKRMAGLELVPAVGILLFFALLSGDH